MSKESTILSRTSSSLNSKRIPTSQLKVGMFLVGVDESWWKSPFFRHNRLLENQKEVDLLLKSNIKEVMIDPSCGLDVTEGEDEYSHLECIETTERLDQSEEAVDGVGSSGESMETVETSGSGTFPHLAGRQAVFAHAAAQAARDDAVTAVESIFEGVKTGDAIDQPKLQHMVEALLSQVLSQGEVMVEAMLIQNLRAFDKALYGHVVDVAVLSIMVGIQLKFDDESLQVLALGGLLHDVGHVRIPRNIHRRRHNLFDEEEALFKRHVELGLAILDSCPTIPVDVRRVVAEHHERQDGSGYPNRLTTDRISSLSEVVGFIDHFDTLISPWGAPPCLPTALAIRKLYQEAKLGTLRAISVEALISCLGVYPIGSLVSLSTGERAIVLKVNASERLKPVVKVIVDSHGKLYDPPIDQDLSTTNTLEEERVIQAILDPAKYKIDVGKYF
ncbi:MAG: HD-GYP domain-containing protein [Nitrospirales bacterium]